MSLARPGRTSISALSSPRSARRRCRSTTATATRSEGPSEVYASLHDKGEPAAFRTSHCSLLIARCSLLDGGRSAMSYDVYVNIKYDDAIVRRIVDLAPRVDFFGDGESLTFPPSDFALHNGRYRGTPAHQFIVDQSAGALDSHGFMVIINRAGRSLALHDTGPGDFTH